MAGKWRADQLGDCVKLQSGGTPSKSCPEFWGGGVSWVSAKDMKSYWINDSEDHLTDEGADNATRIVDVGTTLMLVRGMTLHNNVPICRVRRPSAFNQDVKAVLPQPGTESEFVSYLLLGNKAKLLSMVDSAGHGTGRLNTDTLLNLPVRIPPPKVQRAIAHILGTLDDKIELNRRMNETLEALAAAIFKSWFVDFDPVRAKLNGQKTAGMDEKTAALFPDGFEESELGKIPKGWKVKSLDAIADYQNGLALQKFRPLDGEPRLPVVKIAQLRSGLPDSEEWAAKTIKPECIIDDGDIVFSWSGSLLVKVWCGGRGALNQHLFKVTSTHYPKWFYYHWTLAHLPEFQFIAADKATTMGHIKRHHLGDALCAVPDEKLIRATDQILTTIIDRVATLSIESRTLAALRDTLLPKLLSGELRVADGEKIVEGVT